MLSPAKPKLLALALASTALFTGGCSQTPIAESPVTAKNDLPAQETSTTIEFSEPEKATLENALPIKSAEAAPIAEIAEIDLWQRLRNGYQLLPEQLPANVEKQLTWYQRNPSYLKTVFNRAQPYIYYVTDELDKASLPLELALLPIVESTYDPLAYSHSHAVGLWQFIPSTAKSFGLERDRWYDGRRDVIQSTQAAIKYLSYLHKRFNGDWLLALAAYNSGEGYVGRSIERNRKAGKAADFWSIKLPRETRNYVPQLIALATLVNSPEKYQILLPELKNTPYFEIVDINSQIDLNKVIEITGVDGQVFSRLNPAYRRSITPPEGKQQLLLPVGTADNLRHLLATTDPKSWIPYTEYAVAKGDTLSHISQKFRVPIRWIKNNNKLKTDRLQIGQVLFIPHSGNVAPIRAGVFAQTGSQRYQVSSGDSLWSIAQRFNTDVQQLRSLNNLNGSVLQPGDQLKVPLTNSLETQKNSTRRVSYKVRRGDSLYLIAKKFDIAIRDISRWNQISRNEYLQPGQRLTLFVNVL